jgi:hypothetical protein
MLAILVAPFILAGIMLYLIGIVLFTVLVLCVYIPAIILSSPLSLYYSWQGFRGMLYHTDVESQVQHLIDDAFKEHRNER